MFSAQISIDRGAMIGKARDEQSGGADMQAMRESMASKQITLDDYQKYDNWMLLIGVGLTLLASLVATVFVMRYEPLQILADRRRGAL